MLPLFLAQAAPDVLESATEITVERGLERFLLVLTVSLSVATISRFSNWLRQVPYTLLLVIVGLCLAFLDVRLVDLSPELILLIFLPPLLFEAAWNLEWKALRQDWVPILLYAIFGVVISVLGIGLGLNRWAALPLPIALLIGASLSATDPVSVIALFRELGASKRLTVLMEGESLFNDGVAVVAFGLLVGIPLGQGEFTVASAISGFLVVVGVGVGLGAVVGFGISYLTQRFDLPMVEQSLTLVAAYGTYLLVEELGGSGVIGVVTVGIVLGNFGSRIGMSPRTRVLVSEFWEFLAFFINSLVFLLVGDQIHFDSLIDNLGLIALTIVGMLVSRAIAIYGLGLLSNKLGNLELPIAEKTILWWGGLRGTVSIALALSIPINLPERDKVIAIVFGAVLFTLLVQGLTIQPLLKALNLLGDQPLRQQYIELMARQTALSRVLEYLPTIESRPGVDPEFCRYQTSLLKGEIDQIAVTVERLLDEHPNLREYMNERLQEELFAVEVDTYAKLVRAGQLTRELSPLLEEMHHRTPEIQEQS